MPFRIWVLCILLFAAFLNAKEAVFVPQVPKKPLRFCTQSEKFYRLMEQSKEYVEITSWEHLELNLRYGTFENISGHDLYCGGKRAFLHKDAAKKLLQAIKILEKEYPKMHFVIFDAMRPLYAQEALRAPVRGTEFSHFVSSPSTGSVHNYGMALDLTLALDSNTLDMGTDFDTFERAAGERYEKEALRLGRLTKEHIQNRELLRSIMRRAGFISLPSEWWHFNAMPSIKVRELYKKIDF